jgi:hypothetical protein
VNGARPNASSSGAGPDERWRWPTRLIPEISLLLAIAFFLTVTRPYGTASDPLLPRTAFWLFVIAAGGFIGAALDTALHSTIKREWPRAIATAAAMTPPVSALVFAAMVLVLGHDHELASTIWLGLSAQVFVISLAVMALRILMHRPSKHVVETRTIFAPPVPEAEAAFRSRLSAKRRSGRLLALEAHDHYVRVHTSEGVELITLRFSDAVTELTGAEGLQVHRSWWVATPAIKEARWRRSSGELELEGGLRVPVSRSGAPQLRAAGWL